MTLTEKEKKMLKIARQMLRDGTAVRGKSGIPPLNLCEDLKQQICSHINIIQQHEHWSRAKLANILDMTDSQVMRMLAYHIELFSLDFLVEKLERLSQHSTKAKNKVKRLKAA